MNDPKACASESKPEAWSASRERADGPRRLITRNRKELESLPTNMKRQWLWANEASEAIQLSNDEPIPSLELFKLSLPQGVFFAIETKVGGVRAALSVFDKDGRELVMQGRAEKP